MFDSVVAACKPLWRGAVVVSALLALCSCENKSCFEVQQQPRVVFRSHGTRDREFLKQHADIGYGPYGVIEWRSPSSQEIENMTDAQIEEAVAKIKHYLALAAERSGDVMEH
jgi:hypothetical protein